MLTSISCAKLKTQKHPSETISFHPGLNVVLGSKDGANSIGKSTALLMVDFAFGGKTYIQSDAVRELGDHEVLFTFVFSGKEYKFSRKTDEPDTIICQNCKGAVKNIRLQEYTEWLCKEYEMNYPGVSFRNTLSRFFRIYKKSKIDETQPLKIRDVESTPSAISVLLYLFNHYDDISYYQDQLKRAKDMYSVFTKAQTFKFIPSLITKQTDYDTAQEKLDTLRIKKERLEASGPTVIDKKDVEKANQANMLKRSLRVARKKLEQKKTDISIIDSNLQLGVQPTEADLSNLALFFPNVNLERITKIERFHRKIQNILKDEILSAKSFMELELASLQEDVDKIQDELSQLNLSVALSDEFLAAYTKLDRKITDLEKECDYYTKLKKYKLDKKSASDSLEEHTAFLLHEMEKAINTEMEKINNFISKGNDNAPILRLVKSNSYTFETPRDSGTGTNYKGLLIYDLSILNLTPLPALVHDSLLFSNISNERLKQLMLLYASIKSKQIFIAYDRQDNLGLNISDLLNEHAVIKLGTGEDALFGFQWGKKKQSKA